MKEVVVFDIDKTILYGNLHEVLIDKWVGQSRLRGACPGLVRIGLFLCGHRWLRRKFEYFLTAFLDEALIYRTTATVLDDTTLANRRLLRRIRTYRRRDVDVILVTAAPLKIAAALGQHLDAQVFASRTRYGVLVSDLLAKKARVYRQLEQGPVRIRTVYSDSLLDFWGESKSMLVDGDQMKRHWS